MPYKDKEHGKARQRELYSNSVRMKQWRAGQSPREKRDRNLRAKYGLTIEDYETLFKEQKGRCEICGDRPPKNDVLVVDHDHETRAVRGLLCRQCNVGLGNFKDSAQRLLGAVEYLKEAYGR